MMRFLQQSSKALLASVSAAVLVVAPVYAETIREMQQWWLDAVQVLQAQQVTKGDGIVVAIIDSGVDASHPDLAGALLPGKTFDMSEASLKYDSDTGHGTSMIGLVAARGGGYNNALGVAPAAKVLPIAIQSDFLVKSIAEPIRWAVDNGAKVINLSLERPEGEGLGTGEAEAIAYAQSKDVVVVVAAGNIEEAPGLNELARLPGVVVVTGTSKGDTFWPGSAQGNEVAIAAPGDGVVTTADRFNHHTGYLVSDGTSDSAAIVSGVLALIRAKHPEFNAANAINQLIKTADDKGVPGRDPLFGFGRVNAYRAVTETVPAVTANPLSVADTEAAANAPGAASGKAGPLKVGPALILPIVFWIVVGLLVWRFVRARRRRKLAAQAQGFTPPPVNYTPQNPTGPYGAGTGAPLGSVQPPPTVYTPQPPPTASGEPPQPPLPPRQPY